MKKKILTSLLCITTITGMTSGCSKSTLTAKNEKIEYGSDSIKTSELVEEDGMTGDPEEIDTSVVGKVTVEYSKKSKKIGELDFYVEDTQIPVLTIDDEELTIKTKGTINSEIKSTDSVDGELAKKDKIPTSKETDSSKIGLADFYDEGWYVVDTSKVDTTKAGEYDAKATTSDKHGNTVIVNYKITVSDDGEKNNKDTTIEIKTVDEQEYTIENVTVDEVQSTLTEINTNTIQVYAEEHQDTVTCKDDKKVEDVTKKAETTAIPETTSTPETKKEETKSDSIKTVTKKDKSNQISSNETSNNSTTTNSSKANTTVSHTHNWVTNYKTVHHDAVYTTVHHDAVTEQVYVVDQAAYDEQVENPYLQCRQCGFKLYCNTDATCEEMYFHVSSGNCYSYLLGTDYTTVHHDEVGHYETQTTQEAYDEQVVQTAAYDEKVADGYICSGCGQKKS